MGFWQFDFSGQLPNLHKFSDCPIHINTKFDNIISVSRGGEREKEAL